MTNAIQDHPPSSGAGSGVLAVVIGRAGSKGLPRKNALPVAGVPMIAHTIRFARASRSIGRVVVSTDGDEIAAIAREEGAEVVLRPAALANDTATVDSAVRHAVEALGATDDIIVILYGNVPVRPADLADRAVARLRETGADSVQSYYRVGKTHPYWMSRLDDAGRVAQFIENRVYRRQELPPLFMPDGGAIAVRRASLFDVRECEPHAFFGRDRRGIETREGEVVDVDTALDLAVAEAILAPRMGINASRIEFNASRTETSAARTEAHAARTEAHAARTGAHAARTGTHA